MVSSCHLPFPPLTIFSLRLSTCKSLQVFGLFYRSLHADCRRKRLVNQKTNISCLRKTILHAHVITELRRAVLTRAWRALALSSSAQIGPATLPPKRTIRLVWDSTVIRRLRWFSAAPSRYHRLGEDAPAPLMRVGRD